MICVQRDRLFLVSIVLLLSHTYELVNSQQDNYRHGFGWSKRLRHHHIPGRYLEQKQKQVSADISLHTSLTRTTPPPWKPTSQPELSKFESAANQNVDALAHLSQTSRATPQPFYDKSLAVKDRSRNYGNELLSHWHHKNKHLTAKLSPFSITPAKDRKGSGSQATGKDDDYYYYDQDDGDYTPFDPNGEGYQDQERHWRRTTPSPKKQEELKQQPATLIDDYTFDYLDDEPSSSDDSDEKIGTLTEVKWKNYGTAEAVENSRRRHMSEAQMVSAHITRIHLEALCKYPRPKIIQINDASKRYVPHCTVLHRCSDDTGCCHSDIQTCVAKKTSAVDLYFYVIPFGNKDPIVETLSFINHTECHCVDRHRFRSFSFPVRNVTGSADNRTCHCVRNFDVFEEDFPEDDDSDRTNSQPECRCDCLSENQTCLRLKKGQEGFSVEDRRCISDGRCTPPNCQYGEYSIRVGRCPRIQNKRMAQYQWTFD